MLARADASALFTTLPQAPPEPSSKADKAAAKKRAAKEAARAEIAEGTPTLACRLAGVSPDAWMVALASFADATGKKLSALLKHNALASSGTKMELSARCAEASLLGCLPTCPRCRAARLKWDEEGSKISGDLTVSCPGHYSEDRAAFFACNFVAAASKVKRAPWRSLDEKAADAGPDAAASAPQPELIDDATAARIAALPEPRAAVDAVLAEVTRLKLSVPATANPRTEIGAAMLAHRDALTGAWDARKVLAVLAEKYPPAVGVAGEGGEDGAAGGGDSNCRVAANDGLADAFFALASAADDHWKRNTFNTAVSALEIAVAALLRVLTQAPYSLLRLRRPRRSASGRRRWSRARSSQRGRAR